MSRASVRGALPEVERRRRVAGGGARAQQAVFTTSKSRTRPSGWRSCRGSHVPAMRSWWRRTAPPRRSAAGCPYL